MTTDEEKTWDFRTPQVERCARHATWPEPNEPCWGCEREALDLDPESQALKTQQMARDFKLFDTRLTRLERLVVQHNVEFPSGLPVEPGILRFMDRFIQSPQAAVADAAMKERARWAKSFRAWARQKEIWSSDSSSSDQQRLVERHGASCLEDAADAIEDNNDRPFEGSETAIKDEPTGMTSAGDPRSPGDGAPGNDECSMPGAQGGASEGVPVAWHDVFDRLGEAGLRDLGFAPDVVRKLATLRITPRRQRPTREEALAWAKEAEGPLAQRSTKDETPTLEKRPLEIGDRVRLARVGKIVGWTGAATAAPARTADVMWEQDRHDTSMHAEHRLVRVDQDLPVGEDAAAEERVRWVKMLHEWAEQNRQYAEVEGCKARAITLQTAADIIEQNIERAFICYPEGSSVGRAACGSGPVTHTVPGSIPGPRTSDRGGALSSEDPSADYRAGYRAAIADAVEICDDTAAKHRDPKCFAMTFSVGKDSKAHCLAVSDGASWCADQIRRLARRENWPGEDARFAAEQVNGAMTAARRKAIEECALLVWDCAPGDSYLAEAIERSMRSLLEKETGS